MNAIEKYFTAEKYESVLFVLVGLAAIITASFFLLKQKEAFYQGMAYPLMAVALIQIVVGSTVYLRSPKDITRVTQMVQHETSKIQSEEIPRMQVVMKNFEIYRWVEIVLLLLGFAMYLYFEQQSLQKGIGLGLLIQSCFMLILDYFAESRGKIYLEYLNTLL
jgi:multisubunit Na+/H+ antiporter MnhC subunit